MFDRVFAAAYIDNGIRSRVLGVPLLPFTCWHLFLLQVMDSPFLKEGDVRLYDLRRAVGVCRLRFPRSRTKPPIYLRPVTQKLLEKQVTKFLLHIATYLNKPEYNILPWNEFNQGRSGKNPEPPPEIIALVYDASAGANISITDAWNMPIGQAYIAQAMYLRKQGLLVDFMSEEERTFQTQLKDYFAKQHQK